MRVPVQRGLIKVRAGEQAGRTTSERGDPVEGVWNGFEAGRMGCSEQLIAIPRQADSPCDLALNMAIVAESEPWKSVT